MKKSILTCLFIILCLFVKAQKEIQISGNPYSFEGILQLDTAIKKNSLYSRGLEWFAIIYNNSKSVIQMQDKEDGTILGKAVLTPYVKLGALVGSHQYIINYTIKLSFKDGKMKYNIYDYSCDGFGIIKDGKIIIYNEAFGHGIMDKGLKGIQDTIEVDSKALIDNMTVFMNKVTNKKDW